MSWQDSLLNIGLSGNIDLPTFSFWFPACIFHCQDEGILFFCQLHFCFLLLVLFMALPFQLHGVSSWIFALCPLLIYEAFICWAQCVEWWTSLIIINSHFWLFSGFTAAVCVPLAAVGAPWPYFKALLHKRFIVWGSQALEVPPRWPARDLAKALNEHPHICSLELSAKWTPSLWAKYF